MNWQHPKLKQGGWQKLSLIQQMANIGSEVLRAIKWQKKGNDEYAKLAFYRALELLNLSKADPKHKNKPALKEICRVYECLGDFFSGDNLYHSTAESWQKYFLTFNRYYGI